MSQSRKAAERYPAAQQVMGAMLDPVEEKSSEVPSSEPAGQ